MVAVIGFPLPSVIASLMAFHILQPFYSRSPLLQIEIAYVSFFPF
jgi:hypothetical protein